MNIMPIRKVITWILGSLILLLLIVSCEKIPDQYCIFQGQVLTFEAPDTVQPVAFTDILVVFEGAESTCFNPHHLDVQLIDTTILISTFFSNTDRLSPCPDDPPPLQLTFIFEAVIPGQHFLLANDGSNTSRVIMVK